MNLYSVKVEGRKNKKTIFILAERANFFDAFLLWFLGKIFSSHGYKTFVYSFSPEFISTEMNITRKNFQQLKNELNEEIESLKKREQRNITFFTIGKTSTFTPLIYGKRKQIRNIIMLNPVVNLAEIIWRNQKKKNELKEKKITLKKLKQEWKIFSLFYNTNRFKSQNILLLVSEKNQSVPFLDIKEFIDQLEAKQINFEMIVDTRHNYLASTLIHLFSYRTYLNSIKTKFPYNTDRRAS